ncbi:AfsR/SARP family transcriptional regulator [Streptomyces eurocidicus]|nr:hypothetical protein [Streptomyces eurocidicus]
MRFGILGDTRAWHDDGTEVALGGPARRTLPALPLIRSGAVVPVERPAEEVEPRRTVSAHAPQSRISRPRTALGAAATIERAGTGYRIVVPEDAVDADRFGRPAADGRRALADGDAGRAAALPRRALGLWRGPAPAGLTESGTGSGTAAPPRDGWRNSASRPWRTASRPTRAWGSTARSCRSRANSFAATRCGSG